MEKDRSNKKALFKFIVYSGLGIFLFFVNIHIKGTSAILLQHLINFIKDHFAPAVPFYTLLMVTCGGIIPFINGAWRESRFSQFFSICKFLGIIVCIMAVFRIGPEAIMRADMIPFLFNSVVVPISLMIPVIGIAYVLLLNYGLMEFISTFLQPIMRKIWKTPGESAVDAVVSFSGGYALAVIMTNDLYKKGVYTAKESVIIATGFSTVAISFLLVVSSTLQIMEYWTLYFLSCIFVTFFVTAITARIYPITNIPDRYYENKTAQEEHYSGSIFKRALNAGIKCAYEAKPLTQYLKEFYFGDAIKMSASVTASILAIGLFGMVIAEYTPLFDIVGLFFYPFTYLLRLPEPMLAAKAAGIEIAEMFLSSILVVNCSLITRFTIAVTSVSAVLFFSASIPCLISTDIPITMKDIILIWFERTVFSLITAAIIGYIFL